MENFENIESQWRSKVLPPSPANGPQRVISAARKLKKKQTQSQIILFITVLILALFFFYTSAYKSEPVSLGLGLMMCSLIIRIILEFISKAKLRALSVNQEVVEFRKGLLAYYNSRKWIHYLFTPVLFIIYILGFILLIPVFKDTLSKAFFNYVFYSSIVIFMFLVLLIGVQIIREMNTLQQLKKME